jgi:LPXTG-site transpeptidase (sortase) family protein
MEMSTPRAQEHSPLLFLVFFSWIFAGSLALLNLAGFVPYYVDGTAPTLSDVYIPGEEQVDTPQGETATPEVTTADDDPEDDMPIVAPPPEVIGYLPERMEIPSLKKVLPVASPQSRDVAVLDKALLKAVVRYPGSGLLGKEGNLFVFGHSTGYRTVRNEYFKAFNGIQNLEQGSIIKLYGQGKVHLYKVTTVTHVDSNDALVDLRVAPGERKLTLSTCDSFGAKTSRFVVEAVFFAEYPDDTVVEGS